MCLAANFSGKAINITKTTAPHALSYPFTAHFGINHGHAVSLTLNEFLKFNYKNIYNSKKKLRLKEKFNMIFKIAKVKNIDEFDEYLKNLKKKAGLIQNFKKLNINIKNNLNLVLSGINKKRLNNNPVNINIFVIKKILKNVGEKKW